MVVIQSTSSAHFAGFRSRRPFLASLSLILQAHKHRPLSLVAETPLPNPLDPRGRRSNASVARDGMRAGQEEGCHSATNSPPAFRHRFFPLSRPRLSSAVLPRSRSLTLLLLPLPPALPALSPFGMTSSAHLSSQQGAGDTDMPTILVRALSLSLSHSCLCHLVCPLLSLLPTPHPSPHAAGPSALRLRSASLFLFFWISVTLPLSSLISKLPFRRSPRCIISWWAPAASACM